VREIPDLVGLFCDVAVVGRNGGPSYLSGAKKAIVAGISGLPIG